MSNDKDIKAIINKPSAIEEDFLKEFSRGFYQKITDINSFNTFEYTLSGWIKWIKNINKNTKPILELMQDHKENEILFSSIIGFFYQYGISCNVNKNKALELYLLAVNNEKSLNQNFTNLHLLEGNDDKFDTLQNIN